ncbi:MAG: topoisomerase DNA-binding C4 zinc finger domain-containing protein, partial [Clostridia bacterium]|nr:topoisomerase DNA-binding C4 zinc finger domain-containing protein [Clostridia bacterium]
LDWHNTIKDFYSAFKLKLVQAKGGEHFDGPDEPSDVVCEKCGTLMNYKRGRFGKYLSCPNCKTNKSLKATEEKPTDIPCEKCGSMMVEKTGKYGRYLACPNYPKCKNTKPITEIVGKCPKCNKDIVKRFTKTGKIFYGCTDYPNCDFVSWDIPTGEKCPVCGEFLVKKVLKNNEIIKCSNKNCTFDATKKG